MHLLQECRKHCNDSGQAEYWDHERQRNDIVNGRRIRLVSGSKAHLARLVEEICRGNERALTELFDRQADTVYAAAMVIVRHPHDAEEVVNDVFRTVWMQAERYDPDRAAVTSWLGTMTRSRALDLLRRQARHASQPLHPDSADSAYSSIETAEPVQVTERLLVGRWTRSGLDQLSVPQRRVLRLAFFKGLSHQEIAGMLEMPLGTVKSHCRRGMARLRQLLEPLGASER